MLTAGVANGFKTSSTFHSTELHQRLAIQPVVVTMDTDVDMSLRDQLVSSRIPNNVETGGLQIHSAEEITKELLTGC